MTLPPLLPAGEYALGVWFGSAYEEFLDREVLTFRIWPRGDDLEEAVGRPRVVAPMLEWDMRSDTRMSSEPTVSVVIPTRNRAEVLKTHALPSALAQRDVDVEVVVVDDGSDEDDRRAMENLTDSRVRVVRHATREGQSRARNTGIEAARGEWIAFLDDDDLWSPDKLREQLDAAAVAHAEFVYTGGVMVDEGRGGEVLSVMALFPPEGLLERSARG